VSTAATDRLRSPDRSADWARLRRESHRIVAFSPPDFLGVTQSTRSLFENWYPLSAADVATSARRRALADALAASAAHTVVLSGFDRGYAELVRELERRAPKARVLALWHGNVLQNVEDRCWQHLGEILDLAAEGLIARVGFFKEGMAELLGTGGIDATFVTNRVVEIPKQASSISGDGVTHIGFYCAGENWRKNPFAMLSGASLVDNAVVSGVLNRRARQWCERIGVRLGVVSETALPHDELMACLPKMHCNLYVTMSECSPVLPLESLSVGVPCLVSATSHLFRESEFLVESLVVPRVDDVWEIARHIRRAIECRDAIVREYAIWAVGYNRRAEELLARFADV
jgi:hypothetical protein